MNKGPAREEWLKSEDPDEYAAAMVLCQHAGGYCSQDGFCHFEGSCFQPNEIGYREALKKLNGLIAEEEDVQVRTWLAQARNSIEHLHAIEYPSPKKKPRDG